MVKGDIIRDETSDCVNSIFQQPWWLEAVAPNRWGAATVVRSGRVVARMPYVTKKKFGLTGLTMPLLTQTLGPWMHLEQAKYTNRLAEEKDLMQALIAQLPQFDWFTQSFSPDITNWLPFYWAGFQQTTFYTYRLENLTDSDALWKGLRDNIRTDVRKAQKVLVVRTDLGLQRFLEMTAKTFARQGLRRPYGGETVARIDAACQSRACRRIFFAEDAQGKIHAAVYLVWDDRCAHYLIGGSDPERRGSGAGSLLLWTAIQFAATVTRAFNFEGSMIEPVERHFRAYGSRQTPYFCVMKMSRRVRALDAVRRLALAIRDR